MAARGDDRDAIIAALTGAAGPESESQDFAALADRQIEWETYDRGERDANLKRLEREAGRRRRLRLLTESDLAALQAPEWLIEGLFFVGSLAVLYGSPGVGKSFLCLDWALSITLGRDWAGRPTKQGPVVYVVAEGLSRFSVRVLGWKVAHGVDAVPEIRFAGEAVRLLEAQDLGVFLSLLRELQPDPVLVVFDTLARCLSGGDENSSRDMGLLIDAADRIRQALNCTVVFVHHPGKRGGAERGHGNLRGAADTMVELVAHGDTRVLSCDKQKDAEPFGPIALRLRQVALQDGETTVVLDLDDAPPPASNPLSVSDRAVVSALLSLGGSAATGVLRQGSGIPENTFYKAVKRLGEKQIIERQGVAKSTTYVLIYGPQAATATTLPLAVSGSQTSTLTATTTSPSLEGVVAGSGKGLEHLGAELLNDRPLSGKWWEVRGAHDPAKGQVKRT